MPTCYQPRHYDVFVKIPFTPQTDNGRAPSLWRERLGLEDVPDVQALSPIPLDRDAIKEICRDSSRDVLFGYVCAMAWGRQGQWTSRHHAKKAWEKRDTVKGHLMQLRSGKLSHKEAYELFLGNGKVTGLGPSFFTKLLYFFSPRDNFYIMDQWTGKSINLLVGVDLVRMYGSSPAQTNKGGTYQAFCCEIDNLAESLHLSGDEIEQRLFSKGGGKPAPWREHVKSHYPVDRDRLHTLYPNIDGADF